MNAPPEITLAGHERAQGRALIAREQRREIAKHCNAVLRPQVRVVAIKRADLSRFKK